MASGFYMGTYDPNKVVVVVDHIPVIGFQEGDAITVERSEDFSSETVGIKGEVSRAINRNNTGTMTVILQHNSPSVAQFEQMMHQGGVDGFPPVVMISVFDPASAEAFSTSWAWLKTDPSHGFGDEIGSREYVFFLTTIRQGGYVEQFAPNLAFALANNIGM